MIISRTPFRISFVGGGTDFKDFYKISTGKVISTAIDKYVYITVNKRFDDTIRVSYSKTEIVKNVNQIKHPLIREAMILTGVNKGIEITSIADIPGGTGLGSSSSFCVGLLNALYVYKGEYKSAEALAKDATKIEIDLLKEPIGKQDQYIAAYGGLQYIQFNPDETVFVDPIICSKEKRETLNNNLLLFYTGITRKAGSILVTQKNNIKNKFETLKKMAELTKDIKTCMNSSKHLDHFGTILNESWELKQKLTSKITNLKIDNYYDIALKAGAIGGKLLGAGGGGFLLLYVEPQNHQKVKEALKELKYVPFKFEPQGSKIIYIND